MFFKLLARKLFDRKRKTLSSRVKTRIFRIASIPIGILVGLAIAWFSMDGFVYYFVASQSTNSSGTREYNFVPGSWSYSPSAASGATGTAGLQYMYINSMSGGYYAEYLQIVRDHCNWTKMHAEVAPMEMKGQKVYPLVSLPLGMMIVESGAANEGERYGPNSTLSRLSYANDGKHTLYTYNSEVCKQDNGSTLTAGYYNSLDLYWNGAYNYRTHMQFTASYAALYPAGRYCETATYYPSKLNGYNTSGARGKADTDACYMPDGISIMLQRAWLAVKRGTTYIDVNYLTDAKAACFAAYPLYNYGEANAMALYGTAVHLSSDLWKNKYWGLNNWDSRNSITPQQCMASSMNFLSKTLWDAINILKTDWDGYTDGLWSGTSMGWANHPDYRGFATILVLANGGFMVDIPESNQALKSYLDDGAFMRGATLAYRLVFNDKTATVSKVTQWFKDQKYTLKTKAWMDENYLDYAGSFIYWTSSDCMIYPNGGSKAVPSLHCAGIKDGIQMQYMAQMAGVVAYWKMLKAGGVECTFGDAVDDLQGTRLVPSTLSYTPGDSSGFASCFYEQTTVAENTSSMRRRTDPVSKKNTGSKGVHAGEDLRAQTPTDVAAIRSGKVTIAGWVSGYGNAIYLDLDRANSAEPYTVVVYAHLSQIDVKVGDVVKTGQYIGKTGDTGAPGSPHLHLEVRVYRDGNGSKTGGEYNLPYRALFNNTCNLVNAPGIKLSTKKDESDNGGQVYGYDTSQVLHSDEERTISGVTYKPFTGHLNAEVEYTYDHYDWKRPVDKSEKYYTGGLPRYVNLALKQWNERPDS